tara:strand:+ start:88753 stop:89220 length:468 start_codon:yes stop_codon:yes gene_type:complete
VKTIYKIFDIIIMNTLPHDIIREHILPYTYKHQSQELCDDIKSFNICVLYLRRLYYERWKHSFYYEEEADVNWLDNDLSSYLNDDQPTMLGFTDNCIEKYSRIFILKNKDKKLVSNYIDRYISHGTKALSSINIQIGILTPKEREYFISYYCKLL